MGDTCPTGRNQSLFERGDSEALLNDLLPEFEKADLVAVNLECPLIQRETPIKKCGPNLGVPLSCVNGLKAMGIDVVGLANNHIMDHSTQGLRSTIRVLERNGIEYAGAGENLCAARKILVREVQDVRVGILALAEHEFGIASINEPGVNPVDIIDVTRNINAHRDSFDHLVVLLHGGNELYQYPSPRLMQTCRFLVEQGASAVICQHSHCAGCMEIYHGSPIVYGQGNFLFDYPSGTAVWHCGILICLEASERSNIFKIRLIPYRQSDGQSGARRMKVEKGISFMNDFNARSVAICEESFVAGQWETFCQENQRYYLSRLRSKPGFVGRLACKLGLPYYLDSRKAQLARLHLVRCEAHREILETIFDQLRP